MKKGPYKMKGYPYPGMSPMKAKTKTKVKEGIKSYYKYLKTYFDK